MKENPSILFLYSTKSSWVNKDLQLLSGNYSVKEQYINKKTYWSDLLSSINKVIKADMLYCWFGSLYFLPIILFAKTFRKKIFVVAGGYDVAKTRSFRHGSFDKGIIIKLFTRLLFKLADEILCVSRFNMEEAIENAEVKPSKTHLIYLGFEEYNQQKTIPWNERVNTFLMISNLDKLRFDLKGAKHYLELARLMPDHQFVLIGSVTDDVQKVIDSYNLSNLNQKGSVEFNSAEFNKIVESCRFIVQLSAYESFGAAVVDAAIRGCYPIGSDNTALREVISEHGLLVSRDNIEAIKEEVDRIISKNPSIQSISQGFISRFSIQNREKAIYSLISKHY